MTKLPLLILLLFSLNLQGQYVVKHYTTNNGLANDVVYNILQDKQGMMWFATDNGLSKFNGSYFSNFYGKNQKSNYVIDFVETDTTLLIGTWGAGFLSFNGKYYSDYNTDTSKNLKISKLDILSDSLFFIKSSVVNKYLELYNSRTDSLYTYFLSKDKKLLPKTFSSNIINAFTFNTTITNNKIWIHAHHNKPNNQHKTLKGIYEVNRTQCTQILPAVSNMYISAIKNYDNYTWLVNYKNELIRIQDNIIKQCIPLPNIKGTIIKIKQSKHHIYLLTNSYKLYVYNTKTNKSKNINELFNIVNKVSNFLIDKQDNLWIATNGSGVYKIKHIRHSFIGQETLRNTNVKDLYFLQDTIIVLATEHLSGLKNDTIIFDVEIESTADYFEPYNTQHDIEILNINNNTNITIIDQPLISLISDRIWEFKKGNHKTIITDVHILYNDTLLYTVKKGNIVNVKQDSNFLYVLNSISGLHIYDFYGNQIKQYNKESGLPTNHIDDFILDEDTLWLATNHGLFKVYNQHITNYTTANKLLSNKVNSIKKDQYGITWIGTQNGLNVLKEGCVYSIGKSEGQYSSSINRIIEYNNNLFVLGNNGIFKYDNTTPFTPTQNTRILFNQQSEGIFNLDKINYSNYNSIKTAYKLNDQPWAFFKQDKLSFKQLSEGHYSIQFKYKDDLSDWIYSEQFQFNITKPWYFSPWIYIVCLSVISLMVYRQLQAVKKKNKHYLKILEDKERLKNELRDIRANIARDFHDDLGNKLTIISVLSQTEHKKQHDHKSLKNLEQIQLEADSLYDSMNDFIWSLDNKNSYLHELCAYLNDFGEQLFEHTEITFISTNNLNGENPLLPPYWNKQIILIFKEGMTNVLKHSQAKKAFLNINLNNNSLEITLSDDGIGFDDESLTRKNGINNMNMRMKSIDARLEIKSDNGVSIMFTGDLNL